jgi:hypothetical protein
MAKVKAPDRTVMYQAKIRRHGGLRRLTRLTYGFSMKNGDYARWIALDYARSNFVRIQKLLSCTSAMEAGLTDDAWTYEKLAALLERGTDR